MSVYVISDVIGKAVASKSVPELEQGQQVVSPREGLPDAAALADAIDDVLVDPAARERMGRAGRALVEEDFDVARNAARLLTAWERTA